MFDFYVSSDQAVLELDDDPLIGYLRIHNNPNNPTDVIYCVLPLSQKDVHFSWHSTTALTGPAADLVILTQNLNQKDISIEDVDFRQFRSVTVSDNKFYRDGNRFLVIQEDEHKSHSITFKNCQALSADFFCNKLTWIGGRVKNNLSVELHGLNTELIIKGNDDIIQGTDNTRAVIGTLIIAENIKPLRVCLENVAIITNFSCEGVKSLSLKNVKSGSGICKLIAEEIEELSNFQNLSTEFIVKSEIANIGSFISPIGKVYIDVCSFIEFTTDGDGRFQGLDLNIDVSRAIEKKIQMPYGIVKFDKVLIKGASSIDIPGSLIAEQVEIINCLQLNLDESRIGHLKYQTAKGEVFFGKHSAKPTKIDSLWLIGNIKANFQGPTDLFDLDSEGICHITIFDNYQGKIIKLNLNLDAQRDNINAERYGYFGLHIQNAGNKKVDIEAILAKLNSFNVSGSVKLGQVICQPIDRRYNLIQINVKYLSNISIDGFFAGFDHNIVIEKATGKISLVQSMDRALTTSQIFASVNCAMQDFLTIRAGQGLSFHGNIKIVDGSIELYTLFGVLSARGSLTAKQIKLLAIEGSLDISATLDTYSLVTYAKTESYIHDTIINAIQFLAQTVGHYIQARSNVNTSKTVIISESSDVMLIASRIQSIILEVTSTRDLRVDESSMRATDQAYRGNNVYVTDSNISGQSSSFQSQQDMGIIKSNISTEQVSNIAGEDLRVIGSNFANRKMKNVAGRDIRVDESSMQATDQSYRGNNVYVTDSNISGQSSSLQSQQDIGIVRSNIIGEQVSNIAGEDLRVIGSNLAGRAIENVAGRDISVSDSRIASRLLVNQAEGNVNISSSRIFASQIFTDSQKNITIDGSQILSDNNLFFRSVANYLAISSDIALSQFPTNLFLYNSNARDINGNPLVRCGFQFKEIEALGILDSRGHVDKSFSELQYHLVNSSKIDLSIFQAIAEQNPHSIIIDAHTGVIIGSRLSAKEHQVIIRTKNGLELLPLTLYNATMFGGGFNDTGIRSVISKIEAGAITIDAGSYLKSVGALLRASVGSLKADYIMDQSFINEYRVRHDSLQALEPWLSSPELYDMVVNDQVVPTRLEFSEITKIDLGKGKINLFYPYSSKQVHLRQREGDLNIDRDVHFPYEVMAVHVDSGRIFFGIPKVEHFIINLFGGWFGNKGQIHLQHHTTEHVHVTGQNLFFGASGDIEVHGEIQASGALGLKSGGDIKLLADKHNFGSTVKQSILKAENAYMMANNIEVIGSLMVIKDHFQIVSHNDIKLLPIALMTSYSYHGEKMTSKEYAIKHVVSEINAGVLNIDAGRAVEFISSLIEAEEINLHAKELNIKHAKDIFDKQMEFKGAKKWYGGGRNSWSSYDHTETVLPTVIYADKMKILVDQDATVEAAQIFAQQDILMKVGGNLTVKDGYNLHIHDYQKKSYSLLSFHQGSMKIHTNKNIKNFHEGYTSVPTIICAGGTFYGIVGGTMHILGSKIIGHDIHIAVPNGLKLEASKYTDKSLIFVSESGIKSGYYLKGNQEVGVRAGASFDDEQQKMWQRHIESSELTAANSVTIMVKDGTFEQISSHIAAKIITVEARNWLAKTYDAQIISDHIKQHVEGGVKIAVKQTVTNSLDKIKMLVNKKGSHIIDQLDRAFKAYDIYKSLAALPTNAVTGGLYAYLEASQLEQMSSTSIAVDNTISGEVIIAHVTNDIRFQGVQMTARDVDFTAANFTFETSRDQCDYQYDFSSVNIEIDLNNAINSNLAASTRSVGSSSTIHHANYIKASGNLKITLSGDGKFKGVSLEGANVDIQANNLILESVQDIISERLSGANLHVGFDQKYGITGFGGGVEDGFKDKAWTNQVARIIGSQLVNIIVKETLEIAGGLIANAEEDKNGKLTDKGNLSVNCGRILVKTIHDYDEGVTLGIGASFQVNQTDQKDISFSHAPVKVEFKDHRREVAGTIGQGKITSGEIKGDQLNRDISQQAQVTKEQQGSFDSVVHADMLKTLLDPKEESKRPPNIKTLTRTICGQTLPEMIRDYFFDIADTAKQAAKDVITSGAKAANIFGAKVNPDQLADNLDKGFDWNLGLKLSSEEVQKFNEKYAETKKKLEEKAVDGDEEEKHHLIFQQNLQQQVAQADSDGSSNKAELQALLHIYQVQYHNEQSAAEKEGRPVKSFEEFAAYVNKNYIYKDPVFAAKIHNTLVSTLLETQLMLDARLQSSVEKVDGRSHANQHSSYPEDKTTHHPKFISGGEDSIKSSKVDGKPVSGAGQKQEDEPKATTTVDDKPFDYSMLFLAKPESKEPKLSPDTAALLKAILPFQQVPSSSTTAGGSDWATKEITRGLEGNNFSVDSTAEINIAKYQSEVRRLEKLSESLQGFDKEFVIEATKEYKSMIKREETNRSFTTVLAGVALRYFSGDTSAIRAGIDLAGEIHNYESEQSTITSDRAFTRGKVTFDALGNMAGTRIISAVKCVVGEENLAAVGEVLQKIQQWSEEHLAPGERTFAKMGVELGTLLVLNKLLDVAFGAIKGTFAITKKTLAEIDAHIVKHEATIAASTTADSMSFMGATGEIASTLEAKHYTMVRNHVENLVDKGAITLTSDIATEHQLEILTKFYQKEFSKYQQWNNVVGREYKMKIVGNPQNTGTEGHATTMTKLAIEQAKDPNVSFVFMNQGMKKATGVDISPNIRPDVMTVVKDGKFHLYEVRSKTDYTKELIDRMQGGLKEIPEAMHGEKEVIAIPGIIYKRDK